MKWIAKQEATLENILDLIEFAVEQTEKAIRGEILYKKKPIVINMLHFFSAIDDKVYACIAGIAHYAATGKDTRTEEERFALFLLDSLRVTTLSLSDKEIHYAVELGLLLPPKPLHYEAFDTEHVLKHVKELLELNGR